MADAPFPFDTEHPDHNWNANESQLEVHLGPLYRPRDNFKHGEMIEVARIPKACDDGQDVVIYEGRMPAQFFKLVAEPTPDRTFEHLGFLKGKPRVAYSTGSGRGAAMLVYDMAMAITNAMMSAREIPEKVCADEHASGSVCQRPVGHQGRHQGNGLEWGR